MTKTMSKRDRILFIIPVILLAIGCSATASAVTYYIDYTEGKDSNDGQSTSNAWQRCPGMKGFTGRYLHTTGDQFVFKGGVTWPADAFPFKIIHSGNARRPDIYMGGQRCGEAGSAACHGGVAWGSGYPLFDGESKGRYQSGLIFKSGAQNHVTIDGLKIIRTGNLKDGSGTALLLTGGSGITVKNCLFQPDSVNAFAYSADSGNYSAVYFHDNVTRQAGRVHVAVGNATCNDFQLYNNTLYGAFDYDDHGYHRDGFMIGATGVGSWKATNLKIYNNRFSGDWRKSATAQIFLNGSPDHHGWQHVLIYNNLLVTENKSGLALSPGMIVLYYGQDDIKIYNNTIDARSNPSPPGHCIAFFGANSNIDIKNNILAGCHNGITLGSSSITGTVTIDYNLYHTFEGRNLIWDNRTSVNRRCNTLSVCQASPVNQETHGIFGNPKFAVLPDGSVGSGDWRLRTDSPASGRGANLSVFFTTDILGNIRNDKWDIGAYKK
jgi:hypothetical protein